jgi:hypothetical protein
MVSSLSWWTPTCAHRCGSCSPMAGSPAVAGRLEPGCLRALVRLRVGPLLGHLPVGRIGPVVKRVRLSCTVQHVGPPRADPRSR